MFDGNSAVKFSLVSGANKCYTSNVPISMSTGIQNLAINNF